MADTQGTAATVVVPPTIIQQPGSNTIVVAEDFDTTPGTCPLPIVLGTRFAGWEVVRGSVDVLPGSCGLVGLAHSLPQFVDLDGQVPGSIRTNFATVPGKQYSLSFAYTQNPNTGEKSAQVSLSAGPSFVIRSQQPNSNTNLIWQTSVTPFTATGPTTTLLVDSLSACCSGGIFVDTFRVEQIETQMVLAGSAVTFSVVAGGTAPLAYQWRKDGIDLIGQNGSSLTLGSVAFSDAGDYSVSVTNAAGAVTSQLARLAVFGPPDITEQPVGQTVVAGTNVTLSVGAVGTPPLEYQWRLNGTNIVGATWASSTITNAQLKDTGDYSVIVSNVYGMATSQLARVTVEYWLQINSVGGGSAAADPPLPSYAPNSIAVLTATPNTGFGFINWSGDASGVANPLTVTMDRNKAITANFASTVVTLGVEGMGVVTKMPDKPFYQVGEAVTLVAAPARWNTFTHWSDGIVSNPRVVMIGASNSYTAFFNPTTALETVTFGTISRLAPVGMPAVFVDDASNSQTNVVPGFSWQGLFVVETNASARGLATVSLFTSFPNGTLLYTLDGSNPDVSARLYEGPFVLKKSATLRAIAYNADFTQAVQSDPLEIIILPTLSASTGGGGSVTIDPPYGAYFSDDTALVTATPAPGWTFLQWLGDAAGTNPATRLSMSRNMCVQAIFGTTLTTSRVGSGFALGSPVGRWYPYGSTVRLTALPGAGNYFAFWGNAASGTNNPLSFIVTNPNPTVVAVFASLEDSGMFALAVLPGGFGHVVASPRANRYPSGANVTLTALPEAGQRFLNWSQSATGTNNPLVVTMDQSKFVIANFTKNPRLTPMLCGGVPNSEVFQLLVTGDYGEWYVIDAGTNLAPGTPWETLGTVKGTFGSVQFDDLSITNCPQRFYRALPSPVP